MAKNKDVSEFEGVTVIDDSEFAAYMAKDEKIEIDRQKEALDEWLEGEDEPLMEIMIYRQDMDKAMGRSTQPFLFSFEPTEYTKASLLTFIRDSYGSGGYWRKGYSTRPRKLIFNKFFAIERVEQAAEPEVLQPLPAAESGIDKMLQLMVINQQKADERMVQILASMNRAPVAAPFKFDMAMVQGLLVAASSVKGLFGLGTPKISEFELFTKMLPIMKEMGGGDGGDSGDSNMYDAMKSGMDMLGGVIKAQQENQAIVAAQPQAPVVVPSAGDIGHETKPTVLENPAATVVETPLPAAPGLAELKGPAEMLVMAAKRQGDPALYADMIEDLVPDVLTLLNGQSIGNALMLVNPEVMQHQAWFEVLNKALYEPHFEEEAIDSAATAIDVPELTNQDDKDQNADDTLILDSEPSSDEPITPPIPAE